MKVKLQLNQKAIQEFFLQNVEKIVLGVVVCAFLYMVYSAFSGAERYKKSPEQLKQAAASGQSKIDATPAEAGLIELTGLSAEEFRKKYPDGYGRQRGEHFVAQATQSRVPIQDEPYALAARWDPSLIQNRQLRDTPPLLVVQQLRGRAGIGPFKTTDGLRVKRWVVLTGLVPIEKQERAYLDTLQKPIGYDPNRDYPQYLGYYVERVAVASPAEAANPDWKKAEKFRFPGSVKVQSGSEEVVAANCTRDRLTYPLESLSGRPWDESVAHAPNIPVKKEVTDADRASSQPDAPAGGDRPLPADDPFGGGGPQEPQPDTPPAADKVADEKKQPAFLLFRFFDYSAEPGKHYVYRVQLGLQNPNYDLNPLLLKTPELAKDRYLLTTWSDPSPVISVPYDTRVLLASVKSGRYSRDPVGRVLVATWIQDKGIESHDEFALVRGQVANFVQGRSSRTPTPAADDSPVEYVSNATAIDFRGGDGLTRRRGHSLRLNATGEMLLLTPDGSLVIRNELSDQPLRNVLTNPTATAATPATPAPAATPHPGPRPLDRLGGKKKKK